MINDPENKSTDTVNNIGCGCGCGCLSIIALLFFALLLLYGINSLTSSPYEYNDCSGYDDHLNGKPGCRQY
ncbi:hypothetical protein IQ219_09745 [Synechocystis sp. LEGE 06083]|uniref:hypothetical protein n=1 Tax=Synechocystis sp. LEGE 06083 TaxID=915336 RepID=UPI00187EC111|nr:hypothetical protein [Synechocystis sp. LEGE 06083]MBE9195577.1 hypothetical protein [Synechocystis sp. LEGE 06083]